MRIDFLGAVERDLLVGAVYMEAFEQLFKFVGKVTQYARNGELSIAPIQRRLLILVNYLKRFGGKDDELQSFKDALKKLQIKEIRDAAIETLKETITMHDLVRKFVLDQEDE